MEPKHLAVLRHAKSSWGDPDLDDHERPLNSRGRQAATRIGRHLRDQGILPDLVLSSSALRARETLELLDLDPGVEVLLEDGLYVATAGQLVDRLCRINGDVMSVLLIGHNPTVHELVLTLSGDEEQVASFPTAALADLRLPVSAWDALRPGLATISGFVTPRELG